MEASRLTTHRAPPEPSGANVKNYGRTELLSKYLNKSLWKNPPYIGQG
jgi:hypothetical protein